MAIVSGRSISVNSKPISLDELTTLAERTWSPVPDLNFDTFQRWIEDGFKVERIFWLTRYSPAHGGPGIYFLLKHPEGREAVTIVAPGKKVAEFTRLHSQEWASQGIEIELADISVQRAAQGGE